MPGNKLSPPYAPATTVLVHACSYLAHDLESSMPLVCTGKYVGILGEVLWERIAQALQSVQPGGPYPRADALTLLVYNGEHLVIRCDIELNERGAAATIVRDNIPLWKHAPIPVDAGDDVVAIARRIFAAGLPP